MLTLVSALGRWRLRRAGRARLGLRRPGRPAIPPGLDVEHFLSLARLSFLRLQAAWDSGDVQTLQRLATGPLLEELQEHIQAREGAANHTEVLDLRARLLAFEELAEAFVASVEFSGVIRERDDAEAADFRELWLLTHLKPGAATPTPVPQAWQLAQVQALA